MMMIACIVMYGREMTYPSLVLNVFSHGNKLLKKKHKLTLVIYNLLNLGSLHYSFVFTWFTSNLI